MSIRFFLMSVKSRKLYRSRTDRLLFGVCGGLGRHFEVDSTLIRVAFVILFFADGIGIILYLAMAIIVPLEAQKLGHVPKSLASQMAGRISGLAAELTETSPWLRMGHNVFSMLLIVLGILLLAGQIISVYQIPWALIWPLVLIFLGVYFLWRRR